MEVEPIEFSVEGQILKGNLYVPASPKKLAFLFIHGWTGMPNEAAAEVLVVNGFSVMTFSLRGHNNSQGDINTLTRGDSLKDALASYDCLKAQLPAHTKIGAVGSSYGGYLAALLSVERKLACMSIRVPANYSDEGFDLYQAGQGGNNPDTMAWREKTLASNATQALRAIHAFKGNIQIIEAQKDERVPHQTVQNYVDAVADKSKLEYHLMKNWPHSLGDDQERNKQFQQILLSWAEKVEKQI